LAAFD